MSRYRLVQRSICVFIVLPGASLLPVLAASCGGDVSETHGDATTEGGAEAAHEESSQDGGSGPEDGGGDEVYPASCFIQASSYNLTCSVDSDCISQAGNLEIQFGNYCQSMCLCGGGTINKSSASQYESNVLATPLGSGAIAPEMCGRPLAPGPCCLMGRCATYGRPGGIVDGSLGDGPFNDDSGEPDGSVLCVHGSGPADASYTDGAARWCVPPATCTKLGDGWECCMNFGVVVCSPPPDE